VKATVADIRSVNTLTASSSLLCIRQHKQSI